MTYRDLTNMVDDLASLASPPDGRRSGCFSSTDRASRYDQEADRYLDWAANDDGSGCVRRLENGGIMAMEMEGPGVIWRIWSALPKRGHFCVFFDGEKNPQIDVPFLDWFMKMPGEIPPLNLPELSVCLSRGWNSFIPIPFNRHIRVELGPDWGAYYHFTWTRFSQGTVMPRYAERFSRDGMIALAELDRRLYDRGEDRAQDERFLEARLEPGEARTLWEVPGPGRIAEIAYYPRSEDFEPWALREPMLRLYWDGRVKPAVECPLGDFFGGAPGYGRYRCLPISMERERFSCRFPMPFQEGAKLELVNRSKRARNVRLGVAANASAEERETLRFHAKWHRGFWGLLDRARFAPGGDRWPDWPLLVVPDACGRFCGAHLHVHNAWREPAGRAEAWWYGAWDRKSVDWWWGEGDEKFFVDGEKFPSTYGTGSEDYAGYAWAAEPPFARFDSAFSCLNVMPLDGNGHTGVSRFHVADAVPFSSRFEAFLEKYKPDAWGEGNRCLYAVTPFWYQEAGVDDIYPPIGADSLRESGEPEDS